MSTFDDLPADIYPLFYQHCDMRTLVICSQLNQKYFKIFTAIIHRPILVVLIKVMKSYINENYPSDINGFVEDLNNGNLKYHWYFDDCDWYKFLYPYNLDQIKKMYHGYLKYRYDENLYKTKIGIRCVIYLSLYLSGKLPMKVVNNYGDIGYGYLIYDRESVESLFYL